MYNQECIKLSTHTTSVYIISLIENQGKKKQ